MTARVSIRTYLGNTHIQAAAMFARHAAALEAAHRNPPPGMVFTEHRGFVMGAVLSSVAFLEATVNQLFADADEGHPEHLKGLDQRAIGLMAGLWRQGIPRTARYPILAKYNVVLTLAGKADFDRGETRYQRADLLIKLRNALVHYEPESIPSDSTSTPDEGHPLGRKLRGQFPENPLTGAGNPFYPDKCLGHGCAAWAVTSSIEFADSFSAMLGIKPPYDHVRSSLPTI